MLGPRSRILPALVLTASFCRRLVNEWALIQAVEAAGYEAAVLDTGHKDKVMLTVTGMDSDADRAAVVRALLASPGIREARVHPEAADRVEVVFDPDCTGLRTIFEAVKGAGEQGPGQFRAALHNPAQGQGVDRAAEIAKPGGSSWPASR